MLHNALKNNVDKGDIQAVKYVFVDSLDVDPTFGQYADDFDYAKDMPGFIEPHKELTPQKTQSEWDSSYWTVLKKDLMSNFSLERFDHMRDVAKSLFKERYDKLTAEREAKAQNDKPTEKASASVYTADNVSVAEQPSLLITEQTTRAEQPIAPANSQSARTEQTNTPTVNQSARIEQTANNEPPQISQRNVQSAYSQYSAVRRISVPTGQPTVDNSTNNSSPKKARWAVPAIIITLILIAAVILIVTLPR